MTGNYLLDTDGQNTGEPPYDAFCLMPEGKTFVGNNEVFDFDKCNETYCSEKNINHEAPMDQLLLLLDKSPSCSQTITFNCQRAPTLVSCIYIFSMVVIFLSIIILFNVAEN